MKNDAECMAHVADMLHAIRLTAGLYAVNAVLALSGAVYAIKSKAQFGFERIADHHQKFHSNYSRL